MRVELTGERVVHAPRPRVDAALRDPRVLRRALPGCHTLEKRAEGGCEAAGALTIGPLRAEFSVTVAVVRDDRPAGFSLRACGHGGPAGSAAGRAHVALAVIDEDSTSLAYHLAGELAGPLAGAPPERVEAEARSLIAGFLSRFERVLGEETRGADREAGRRAPVRALRDTPTPPPDGAHPPPAAFIGAGREAPREPEAASALWRWLQVALGLLVIYWLLSDPL